MRKQQGSALVFVLIIIAGIVTVTIGTQRLSLVQFNQATREEDNTFALYAAKAGVEDGLLRFRHERDVETAENKVHRFNLTDGDWSGQEEDKNKSISAESDYSPANQYYDLAINFRTDHIGNPDALNDPDNSTPMKQDEEIELTGFPNDFGENYYLRFAFQWDEATLTECRNKGAFVQVQEATFASASGSLLSQKVARIPMSGNSNVYQSRATSDNLLISSTGSLASMVRMRAYHCPIRFALKTAKTNNGTGIGANAGPNFDSLTGKITATGYFGKAKRTLEATVDRKTGRLISIYDFNLYSGEGCISADLDNTLCD